jgi:hypothetical protein
MEIPKPSVPIPYYVSIFIDDEEHVRRVAARFFVTVHNYWPIISKKTFYDRLINPLLKPRADVALLCLCIRLVTWRPSESGDDPLTETYLAAKRYYVELEIAGVFSIQALQAGVLIALYELGHGIYPSAYMSISGCAAYGHALSLHEEKEVHVGDRFGWNEREERRRVWWSIIILERYSILITDAFKSSNANY